ncbi:transglycosylase domain-containing protein [Salibacterium halotolerans]|uniref:Penicillin-binding protein 1A n=1 Tax=Salibacterium halotolerans TaxID=1884432 RepID=A0A1I5UK49_9BACI|nr:transglycosylase domain-containing protein [Salibacterium halotolerans]SFP95417.1 penicillin-binding protein 1A [Salibacterium halotolerans]
MRMSAGYLFIALFMVMFSVFLLGVLDEEKKAVSFEKTLEDTDIKKPDIDQNSYIYDETGAVVSELSKGQNRRYLDIEDIPRRVKQAFLSTEDRHFFEHEGVDMTAVARALAVNAKAGSIEEGGSTITQQTVRNLFLSHEQSYNRKLTEVLYAYQMEQEYSKEKILEFYINSIYFQNGVYGFETAAHFYFGKPSSGLTLAETAFLAAVPANPSHYDPLTKKENTKKRQEWILTKMQETGAVSTSRAAEARKAPINLHVSETRNLYPDYTFYVEKELKELIRKEEGFARRMKNAGGEEAAAIEKELEKRVREVLSSGVHIETSLDPDLQQEVTNAVDRRLRGKNGNGAAVVLDHRTSGVKALSGGKNYEPYSFNRAFQAYRQPGSSIKPLLVYGPYMDLTGADRHDFVDAGRYCKGDYCPSNAGGSYPGQVTLETALARSYNTAAMRLFEASGIQPSFSYLESFGFDRVGAKDHYYAAALGGLSRGVSLLELSRAYTTFSNGGQYKPARAIKKVTDGSKTVLYEWDDTQRPVWNDETNQELRHMMRSVITEGTGRRADPGTGEWRGKTGTTNNYQDLWFVGYNSRYTAGVWIGRDQPESLGAGLRGTHLNLWRDIAGTAAAK